MEWEKDKDKKKDKECNCKIEIEESLVFIICGENDNDKFKDFLKDFIDNKKK